MYVTLKKYKSFSALHICDAECGKAKKRLCNAGREKAKTDLLTKKWSQENLKQSKTSSTVILNKLMWEHWFNNLKMPLETPFLSLSVYQQPLSSVAFANR
jgi:hypothetical protein